METKYKVLLLEDNKLFAETVKDFLEDEGYEIDIVADGEEAISKSYYTNYDIYLLDINVPFVNGVDFLKMLRRSGDERPTIFITSHQDIETLKRGYECGCDDYMKKPIDLQELLYRMQVLLRIRKTIRNSIVKISKECKYDFKQRALICKNRVEKLPPKAIKLLELLLENEGEIVTKEQIVNRLWSSSSEYSEGSIRVYVNKLKKILKDGVIENIKGIGYKLCIKI